MTRSELSIQRIGLSRNSRTKSATRWQLTPLSSLAASRTPDLGFQPEDTLAGVGEVAAFAASDRAATITGAAINMSCGAMLDYR